jgi:hypothetical protein
MQDKALILGSMLGFFWAVKIAFEILQSPTVKKKTRWQHMWWPVGWLMCSNENNTGCVQPCRPLSCFLFVGWTWQYLHCNPYASVTHSGFLLPSLIGPFPIKICQKSDQDPVIRGWKFKLYYKICKNIYLITTTIRYCSGSVPIQPFPAEFIPILPFSIRF